MKNARQVPSPYTTEYEISRRLELFKGLREMIHGFYELYGCDEKWWKHCSWSTFEDELIEQEWNKIDWGMFMDVVNKIEIIMMGSYCDPKRFLAGMEQLKADGVGVYDMDRIRRDEE